MIGGSPGRSISYESDNELRMHMHGGGADKSKDNDLKGSIDYSDDDDERLDIDDESPGPVLRKLPPASADKVEGNETLGGVHSLLI